MPSSAVESTDADMMVFNDNPQTVTITVDHNVRMGHEFPSPSIIAAGGTASSRVSASWVPGQSSFDIHYASGDTMTIDLGTGPYSTNSTPETFSDGESAAVLAPGPPLTTDVDYRLWFFNGPGILPPLINSFIQANLPAAIAYINQHPITIPAGDSISLQITNIDANPQTLQCVYAGTLPQSNAGNWYLNAVIRIGQAKIQGNATIKGQTGDFTVGVTDAMIWVQAQIDPTLQTKPQVQQLQMSLGDYTIEGTIIGILETLFPFIALLIKAGATAYRVAGAINNQFNTAIISGINNALKKIGGGTAFLPGENGTSPLDALYLATHLLATPRPKTIRVSPAPGVEDLSQWMSTAQIQALTLGKLKIPGTHDSATYQLSSTLSQILYPDIQLLWYLSPSAAPVDGNNPITIPPTQSNPDYLGQLLCNWVLGVGVNSISRTQDLTILQQLQAGIRHFDFRVYFDTRDSNFYIQHALQGPKFQDILTQFQDFLSTNADSGELIFAVISHTNFSSHTDQIPVFANLIKSAIPAQNLYYQPVPPNQTQFDFQSLAGTTVGSITNGAPKIMFINGDSPDVSFVDTLTNTGGYSGVPWNGELYSVTQLSDQQGPPTQASHDPLWSVGWVLGADTPTIVRNILVNLTGVSQFALQNIANGANGALQDFFQLYGTNFNLLIADWFEYGASPSIPEMVISMNLS